MNKDFSKHWQKSKKPGKKIKFLKNAPLHVKKKLVRANLSKELREKSGKRSFGLRRDDKVKIVRGQFKGKSGKVESVIVKKAKSYITGIETIKKEGSKTKYPINVSNLVIENLNLEDKKRENKFNSKGVLKAADKESKRPNKGKDKNDKKSS